MLNLILASLGTGMLFGAMDAGLNANPLARRRHAVYALIAKTEVIAVAGTLIDLAQRLVIVLVFLRRAPALPGKTALARGLAPGLGP